MPKNDLTAVALACSLRPSPSPSSSYAIAQEVMDQLASRGVTGPVLRVADYDVRPGIELDRGDGDEWPYIREQIVTANIVVIATPTWMGQPSSLAQRVLERLDAELSETDDDGRMLMLGKVAIAAVVGNEDGAQHIYGILFQAFNDVGFTSARQAATYWNDEVGGDYRDYIDLDPRPEAVLETNHAVAAHAAHLADLLAGDPYPAG